MRDNGMKLTWQNRCKPTGKQQPDFQAFGRRTENMIKQVLFQQGWQTSYSRCFAHRNTAHSNPRKSLRIFTDDSGRTGPDISSRPLQ
ncbi:hypothetical protein HZ326_26169 [Fusarium oxysporum f. sp. albedinis]|nr:hypothetical protein HZ326_26169 [Fusarium oxysporum f. sp. albedinis]